MYDFLHNLEGEIPDFQRSYEWTEDEINDFLDDLDGVVNNSSDNSPYFFGSIVTTDSLDNKTKEIIDGQQRITTSTVFLSVLRNLFYEYKECARSSELMHSISNDLIGKGDARYPFKLKQRGSLERYFKEAIQFNVMSQDIKNDVNKKQLFNSKQEFNRKSTFELELFLGGKQAKGKRNVNNLYRAYNLILRFFKKKILGMNSIEDKINLLERYYDVFTNRFYIVEIFSPDRSIAYQLFQTINVRGKDLSTADLLRSNFLGNSGEENVDDIVIMWEYIVDTLGNSGLDDYIRYVWNSKYSFSTARQLYKRITSEIKDVDDIYDFVYLLQNLAKPYAEMTDDYDETYIEDEVYGQKTLRIFKELRVFGFRTFYPIYLAMINSNMSDRNIYEIMNNLKNVMIRNKILDKGANWLEKLFAEMAFNISNDKKNKDQIVQEIKEIISDNGMSDEFIKPILIEKNYSSDKNLIRYILRMIENANINEKEGLPINNNSIHIEHIMPVVPIDMASWGVNDELHNEFLWKIGNLTLLKDKLNNKARNSNFAIKKDFYKKSDVFLTRDLADYDNWTTEEIKNRTNNIIDDFLKI